MNTNKEDESIHPPKPYYSTNYRQNYASSSSRNAAFVNSEQYADDEVEDEQQQEDEEEENERYTKKRKYKSLGLGLGFESGSRDRNRDPLRSHSSPPDWTDILLEAWGDRFLELGRKSLRSEDWTEVAEKVSKGARIVLTERQCRNKLDMLKRRYKIEKTKVEESGGESSQWVYFDKMEMLMAAAESPRKCGLSCGLDSGEFVFMNPEVYLDRANGVDEMRDSPGSSECDDGGEDGGKEGDEEEGDEASSFRMLADSIENFRKIYEKIESNKRKNMLELEKMRMEFNTELELQKRQVLERVQAEIEKIQEYDDGGDDEEDDDDDDEVGDVSE